METKKLWGWGLVGGACLFVLILTVKQKQTPAKDSAASVENQEFVASAKLCSSIKARLKRLECFDQLFPASIDDLLKNEVVSKKNEKPKEWLQARASEALRKDEEGFRVNILDEKDSETSMWFTARAQGDGDSRPILQLGCMDKISRVELVLDKPVANGRISITVMGNKPFTQQWTSDESGMVLRPGRGLPAIYAMRAMLKAKPLVIRSDVEGIDGLSFDNRDLAEMIQPMRKICGW